MTNRISANPWLGLNTYRENDRLYGRDRESEEVSDIIRNNILTVIYGRSGIGKSSLLQAGVFPRLRYNDLLPVYIRLEHNSETDYISQIVSKIRNEAEKSEAKLICDTEISSICSLSKLASGVSVQDEFTLIPRNITLVFDQFEEIFTLPDKAHKPAVDDFFVQLSEVLNTTVSEHAICIVICLREDYLYFLEQASVKIPSLKRNRYSLRALTREQGRDVICLPRKGLVSEDLAEKILDKIDQEHSDVIAPSILSLFMHELYEKGNGSITQENISMFGDHIINDFYEEGMKSISPKAVAFLEDRLVTSDGYRHFISYNDALAHGVTADELEKLKERRIITIEKGQKNQQIIEFSHDVLCPIVVRNRNERNLNEEAERLRAKEKAYKRRKLIIITQWTLLAFSFLLLICTFLMFSISENEHKHMLANQSRFVAKEALELAKSRDKIKAMALVSAVSPKNYDKPERPFTCETYEALNEINEKLESMNCVLCEHNKQIYSVQSSNDGKYIVTASEDKTAIIVDIETKKCLHVLQHPDQVYSAIFSPNSNHIVTTSSDNNVRIWNVKNGNCEYEFNDAGSKAFFSPNGKFIVTLDRFYSKLWDIKSGQCIDILHNPKGTITDACFSPDMKLIATSTADNTIKLWDLNTRQCIKTLINQTKTPEEIHFSPDSKYIISTTSWNDVTKIWDIAKEKCIKTINTGQSYRTFVQFNSDGNLMLHQSGDVVTLWDTSQWNSIASIENKYSIYSARLTPDGKAVIISEYNKIKIWDIETKRYVKTISNIGNIHTAEIRPNGQNAYSLDNEGKRVVLWNLYNPGNDKTVIKKDKISICKKLITSVSHNLSSDQEKETVRIWNCDTGKCIDSIAYDKSYIKTAQISPDRKSIAISSNKNIKIFNIDSKGCIDSLEEKQGANIIQFTTDGKYIISDSYKAIKFWDIKTTKCVDTLVCHNGSIESIAISPDGKYILTASRDSSAKIWDINTKKCIDSLIGHSGVVYSAQFSPDGKTIATASNDKTIKIWSVNSHKCIKTFLGNDAHIISAKFSPNGRYILSISSHNIIYIWDVEKEHLISRFKTNCAFAEFNSDGTQIISGFSDQMKLWNFYEPQELIDLTMKKLNNYTLSDEDRRTYYLE